MFMLDSFEKQLAELLVFGLLKFFRILVTAFGGLKSRRGLLFAELGVHRHLLLLIFVDIFV